MHFLQILSEPALSILMGSAFLNWIPCPSTVSAYALFVLIGAIVPAAVVLAIAPSSTPVSAVVVASSAVVASAIAVILLIVLLIVLAIVMIHATIIIAMIAVVVAGSGDQCFGLPANSKCSLSLC